MVVILGPLEDTAPTFTFIGAITAVSAYNQRLIKDPPRLVFELFLKKPFAINRSGSFSHS